MSFLSAYLQGEKAFKDGLSLEDNPYKNPKTDGSWSQNWKHSENKDWWIGGFNDAQAYKAEKLED